MEQKGYKVEDIIEEDWGRCLMYSREPFMLWVGCGSVTDDDPRGDGPPAKEDVTWHCFATAEVLFWKRLFRKIETEPALSRLNADLGEILRAELEVRLVEEP